MPELRLLEARHDRVGSSTKGSIETSELAPPSPDAPAAMRRQHVRAPYVTPVRIIFEEDGTAVDGRTEDISEGGAIVTNTMCANHATVRLRMPLPTSGRVVSLVGRTRWTRSHRTQRAVGVELIGVPEEVKTEIRRYVGMMSGSLGA